MGKSKVKTSRKGNISKAVNKLVNDIYESGDVTVGVHDEGKLYPETGVTVSQAAFWNEFGTPNAKYPTPERSFLRSTARDQKTAITRLITKAVLEKIRNPDRGPSYESTLNAVGARLVFAVQNKIKSNIPPENAPSTLAKKRAKGHGSRTLIDTGTLLRSIDYRIEPKNGA